VLAWTPAGTLPGDLGVWIAEASAGISLPPGEGRPEVVILQVADSFAAAVEQMRDRGYHWYLVIHVKDRGDALSSAGSFYANYPVRLEGDTSHAFFFRERETFSQAHFWCAALLRRTYFRFRQD
jgi:hypothetical protein